MSRKTGRAYRRYQNRKHKKKAVETAKQNERYWTNRTYVTTRPNGGQVVHRRNAHDGMYNAKKRNNRLSRLDMPIDIVRCPRSYHKKAYQNMWWYI